METTTHGKCTTDVRAQCVAMAYSVVGRGLGARIFCRLGFVGV